MSNEWKKEDGPIASIIIPAYNEERVIDRCLRSILTDARPGEFEVIVACNGCTDNTAFRASIWSGVITCETDERSKTAALNQADEICKTFPRIYLDADVVSCASSMRKIAHTLRGDGIRTAGCPIQFDTQRSNVAVKAFYAIWKIQPYFDSGHLGSGIYAVNRSAHSIISPFPSITADDEWARLNFDANEISCAKNAFIQVETPETLSNLIGIKTRSRRGNYELRRRYPFLAKKSERKSLLSARILARPWLWLLTPIYIYVVLRTKRAAAQTLDKSSDLWERDSRPLPQSCSWDI